MNVKIGKKVAFQRRNGQRAVGKVTAVDTGTANGDWVTVNTAEPRKAPQLTKLRPSQLSAA
jgi:hypothetical protein